MVQRTTVLPSIKSLAFYFILAMGALFLSGCASLPASSSPTLATTFTIDGTAFSLAYSPDGTKLAIGFQEGGIEIWDTESLSRLQTLEGHTEGSIITDLAFSPDGETLASSGADRMARLWQVSTGELLHALDGHGGLVKAVSFSKDGATLATASWDTKINLWQVSTGELDQTYDHYPNSVNDAQFSPNGITLASVAGNTLGLWQLSDDTLIGNANGHLGTVKQVLFSSDGETMITSGDDRTVRLWQASDGTALKSLEMGYVPYTIALLPTDNNIIAINNGSNVDFWNLENEEQLYTLRTFTNSSNYSMVFRPDGQILATIQSKNTIQLWNLP
ncbi:WD40 repeat domain-containing protein [Anaerolineales bacterium HSG6]|nr:WD40 repeat domain-containing protein [Anaerolineales bacterium HSG6]MDM8530825.1 WD40 repeat domain-containing protein [Anaerolineales bacterium HSG25]